ncbi:esterase-like activity of phytase family protein [Dongia sedimenti]|uniref:Esterase-like activity of phytase family protein n=1 Tax=Dongia sedimenti TaxID=3064282 RepID=A0ABU0YGS4_9PROT|nr:esterase-like activity of phytase family protein [Rhodospirillaceae bacterium R-7]
MSGRILLLAAAFLTAAGTASAQPNTIGSLHFLGATTLSNYAEVDGTLVGGLSGLDYNPVTGTWAIISDDRSDKAPARFYLGRIDLTQGAPKVSLDRAVVLRQPDGKPFPNAKAGGEVPDPESIRFDPSGTALWWTSEGDRKRGLSPFIRKSEMDGAFSTALAVPSVFTMHKDKELGPRNNNAFEGLSFTPNGDALWLAMESALYQDGPAATVDAGAVARFSKFDLNNKLLGQYAYPLDSIQAKTAGEGSDNGVSEILALDDHRLLVVERSGVNEGGFIWTLHIRLYEADVADASNLAGMESLVGASYRPMTKRLILNLDTLPELGSPGLPRIDNIEGAGFGPDLPNGHRSLVLVSDNNFNPLQVTQFLAFEVLP